MDKKQLIEMLSLPCSVNDLRLALLEYFQEDEKIIEIKPEELKVQSIPFIGSIFKYENKKFKVVQSDECDECYFLGSCNPNDGLLCTRDKRPDEMNVIFVEVTE